MHRRLERDLGHVHVHCGPFGLVDDGAGFGDIRGIDDPGRADVADSLGVAEGAEGERGGAAGVVILFGDRLAGRQGEIFDDEIVGVAVFCSLTIQYTVMPGSP
jgi:hypothetical protein